VNEILPQHWSMDDESFLHTYKLNVSEYEEVSNFFSYIKTKHLIFDSLVNNAEIYLAKNIMEYQEVDINNAFLPNVQASVVMCVMENISRLMNI
jgi:3-oxoacyl-[acyl-carrier protein] reductase